ncbi:MAG: malto-oligosyltrehalose trehalohydrolase [Thaumarchaeota archaeon]|nr:malto-oligosyltrehalose trehalohydrolase [Nitrososphaerota archaeon]
MRAGALAAKGEVEFRVWSPFSKKVDVAVQTKRGDWTREPMQSKDDGFYGASVEVDSGTKYMYVLDGKKTRPDPISRYQPKGVMGPSEVVDPEAFPWTDQGWRGVDQKDLLIYEVHTGTYTKAGTFESIRPHLRHLREELGVTAIELMPVGQFPGDRNWGYDGVFIYAVQNSYGGPAGLKALVDDCHAHGMAVLLDVVYNHVGPEGNCLADYGPYFSYKYKTPWGPAMNFDDRGCDEVRRFVVDNARYWVTEYHLDGIRLDAVHGLFDFSPRHILTEIGDAIRAHESALHRRIHVIAESDLNDPRMVSSKAVGGYGLAAQWSDDFHHAVHSYLTGERQRYYEDFGDLADIEKAIRDGFVYDGRYSKFRGRTHGAPSVGLQGEKFVICIQNHDQVGNRHDGARLSTLLGPSAVRAAIGLLLLAPNIPLIFMGEEFGEVAPFYYFTSHRDPKLAQAVREGRRKEFPGGPLVDPQDRRTFERSKVNHALLKKGQNAEIFRYYMTLIAMRSEHPALRSMDKDLMEVRMSGRTLGVRRWQPGVEDLAVVYALGEAAPAPGRIFPGRWSKIFDSEHGHQRNLPDASPENGAGDRHGALFGVTVYRGAGHGRGAEATASRTE